MKKLVFVAATVILVLVFVVGVMYDRSQKAEQAGMRAENNQSALVRPHSRVLGPATAKVQIVEFLDPACETCRRFYPLVKQLLAAHPDQINLVVRYAPFHDNSTFVVALLEAAGRQGKYWETLEALLNGQEGYVANHAVQPDLVWKYIEGIGLDITKLRADMLDPAISKLITQDLDDARVLNVTKTPEFFVNGKPLPSFGFEQLQRLVDEALSSSKR